MEERTDNQPYLASIEVPLGVPLYTLGVQPSPKPLAHTQRTWPAVLALYVLAPFIAEMMTGSTPPLRWNNVAGIVLTTGLYGSGAILARELVRRRGLGWGNLALLGAAYGVLEEGMTYQSWFNPNWIHPPDRFRFFEVNWTLALIFTTIHVTLSILSSIVVAEAIFPTLADRPWLSRKGFVGFTIWLILVASWLGFTYGFLLYHGKGYDHPPIAYVIAPILFGLFLWLGLRRFSPKVAAPDETTRRAPHLWTLRLLAFAAACIILANLFILRVLIPFAFIPIVIVVGVDLAAILLVRLWAKCSDWGPSHRLALATGVMGFFMVVSPLFEFVLHMTGILLVNLLVLGGLIWLARRTARWEAARTTNIAVSERMVVTH